MKLIIQDDEVEEKPILIDDTDRGIVIRPTIGERGNEIDSLTKEIIANDAIEVGITKAAEIHGVSTYSASRYKDGEDIGKDEDVRSRVLAKRHGIADLAVSKLMESLNLFNPSNIEKPRELISAARDLAAISKDMAGDSKSGDREIHLHLYSPKQRPLNEYTIIDV